MKVFIVGGGPQYARMFIERGWEVLNEQAHQVLEADLIQFTGGEDVTPEIYGEKNTSSYNSLPRDLHEAGFFAIAKRMGKPMAGICRGGQFLNVMCGGSMIQHVEGHAIHGTHEIYDQYTESVIQVTSTHHQMMIPAQECELIAFANIVNKHFNNDANDAEVVNYPDQKCLCFQPHPEHNGYKECRDYYFELLNNCLGLKV